MATAILWMIGLGLVGAAGEEAIELREAVAAGSASHVLIELNAAGTLRPAAPEGAEPPPPVRLKMVSRLDFDNRVLSVDRRGRPLRDLRRMRQAAVAINTPGRPLTTQLRSERALLVAEVHEGAVRVFSPGGPLTRPELDLVQGPADPLMLGGLLPDHAVAVGDTWTISTETTRALSDYEALAASSLKARLDARDADSARVHLTGQVRGAARGGEGTITFDGQYTFDRRAGRIGKLTLTRAEVRKPGQVEAGFDFQGTLTLTRTPTELPVELGDAAAASVPGETPPHLLLLEFRPPGDQFRLFHDRDWHLFWSDARISVLKRLDHGELLAQCNLSIGPEAGAGRHQDLKQFREDIRAALGARFGGIAEAGELDDGSAGGFRYRMAVQGKERAQAVLWYYYLIASPGGAQVLATFTLNAADAKRFADQDVQMIGSLEWLTAAREHATEKAK